ncbi:MAG: Re/Si-specific NAD(P)(+) transhydrogenase subunit alpha [Bifidobacterium tibiigranuli]|nr:Re/Si-specific NAD(P)(+) transhydrogenase subunit alpha [Bifidobacterium tibiigranuli]MCI1222090.1 Re/Si-specific NAD(P)(+) transhydrogenase subunit alpha [Bifidobacterium tibiigranuli]MCI1233157.1 Re/Si-specific NAD(P)(+) transhydrogenase subunit alpha [Bifidobacterium tibiigranuli]MCI1254956.1 Re/Si-specific NAD(P)(+) transhydrogenase subunit alpha [Bifidobacterium tibiigranuli]MCI1792249.1 Re/Si-specific NAD(P)(+) transhydrogenase subunit alpha [Bifidobacterium tibiigranuli]
MIGIPKETLAGERLVAATPKTVTQLRALGYEVAVERGAGVEASYSDKAYSDAGASIVDAAAAWGCGIVTTVNAPAEQQVAQLRDKAMLISRLAPHTNNELLDALASRDVTALALDAVPRISRAQSIDVLSTMSNVSGYRAVIEAAEEFGGMFTGQVTAAGKTQPAKVFVIGGGVAGLAAIGAAVSLGAEVRAFDVRPEAGEQIESLGATFVQAKAAQQERSSTGYAKALSDEQERATLALYAEEAAKADIIITTALVRGSAVRTITKEAVAGMRSGSVIVDVAATGGGNCELTVPGSKTVSDNGVTIIGYTDLASRMPRHTSQLFGTNVVNLMKLLTSAKDGKPALNLDDPVQRGMTVTNEHQILWPPPAVAVSAASTQAATDGSPVAPSSEELKEEARRKAAAQEAELTAKRKRNTVLMAISGIILAAALAFTDAAFLAIFSIFVLAIFVGYYVVSNVSHSLHTPLMSQTNAISGIILIGSLLQIGSENPVVTMLAVLSAAIASINVFGGFLVTYRMLSMFRKDA